MKTLDLVKLAIKEYYSGDLSAEQCITNINIVVNTKEPSPECIEWGRRVAKELNKGETK